MIVFFFIVIPAVIICLSAVMTNILHPLRPLYPPRKVMRIYLSLGLFKHSCDRNLLFRLIVFIFRVYNLSSKACWDSSLNDFLNVLVVKKEL